MKDSDSSLVECTDGGDLDGHAGFLRAEHVNGGVDVLVGELGGQGLRKLAGEDERSTLQEGQICGEASKFSFGAPCSASGDWADLKR